METEERTLERFTDEELLARLASRHQELEITIHELEASRPSIGASLLVALLSVLLLLASIGLVLAPYFIAPLSGPISTMAAFAVVILLFIAYWAFRRCAAEIERRRLYGVAVRRAIYLEELARLLLQESDEVPLHPEAAGNVR